MALVSPGVEVDIIDQSQYLPAAQNSVPLVVVATAQNKADPTGVGVAQATTAANAGQLYLVTSQRDLVSLYGNPFFYTTTNGTPIQGYELNEYGLLAAYSTLGVTNQAYILRADIDLASLVGKTSRPVGQPANGTYWLDTTNTDWGIYEFNASTGKFTNMIPHVITDSANLSDGYPLQTIGNIGDYAVDAINNNNTDPVSGDATYFFKNSNNQWVKLGSAEWLESWPTIQGTQTPTSLTPGNYIRFKVGGPNYFTVTVGAGGTADTLDGFVQAFNNIGSLYYQAANVNGKFVVYNSQTYIRSTIAIDSSFGTILSDLGIAETTYNSPIVYYGTSSQFPLWTSTQSQPRPSGSVWIKVGSSGTGLAPVLNEYVSALGSFKNVPVNLYNSDFSADAALDTTGGGAIPAGTVYCQYNYDGATNDEQAPLYYFERVATGPTVVTGTVNNPDLSGGPYTLNVQVSQPGSTSVLPNSSSYYTLIVDTGSTVADVVTAWQTTNIPYTTAQVSATGALTLTHTAGGEIILYDNNLSTGQNTGLLMALGLEPYTTTGCKSGPAFYYTYSNAAATTVTGVGTGAHFAVLPRYNLYFVNAIVNGGSGYAVGDSIKIPGNLLGGVTPDNDLYLTVTEISGGAITSFVTSLGTPNLDYGVQLSNWYPLEYTANDTPIVAEPANDTNWYYSADNQIDFMVNYNGHWYGYRNLNYDSTGFPTSGSNTTDPNGPICQATMPTTQSDGTSLVYGDLWVDTGDLVNYPMIYRWESMDGMNQWVAIDSTDQTDSKGVLFADARWSSSGAIDPVNDAIPTIQSMLQSNYIDLDAPSPALYPSGMLLWNTRRSGYNVKQFRTNYFTNANYPNAGDYNPAQPTNVNNLPEQSYTWVTVSGNQQNGAMYAGSQAQRALVVKALNSVMETNTQIRDEDNYFNLIATPNYPECQSVMITLNNDRNDTAFIVGDTPMTLPEDATAIQAWATDANDASETSAQGLVTRDTYMGLFYPSGLSVDLSGNQVVVPSSHMMLRTIIRNDSIAYPWFAPAGTRRGLIDNALSIGYLDATTGEFVPTKTRLGIRDVLYTNAINPMVYFTGQGLLNYGNKSSFESNSALDRINVARLIAYMRRQLTIAARPFVFEPNDAITRAQIQGVIQSLCVELVAKRGIYDYLVVCDDSNNTPARIDRNELWVDVAIEPVKAAEFIYIPVRILNTGALAAA
jgi:Phage tail sheath C-terminal domain